MFSGNLKSLLPIWKNLASNRRYSRYVEEADIKTFLHRAEHEGLPFLTIALPELGRALDTFHATETWSAPASFHSDADGIPLFLGKAIRFALEGNSVAVDCVRQLSYVFYKLEVKHDDEKIQEYIDHFKEVDHSISGIDYGSESPDQFQFLGTGFEYFSRSTLVRGMRSLICEILANTNPRDIRPCHGSGATACRTHNWDKWHQLRYYQKLDQVFDYSTYFYYSSTHLVDEYDKLVDSSISEPMARVLFVPKDSRGPRVISCEPAELMYIQQGLMRKLYDHLEHHPLTCGQLNFTDQFINRNLAKLGSETNYLATLDLKDASDRVSLDLVRLVFPDDWVECLEACRSENTILPDGQVVKLHKFAPMGSSCCFPVEALVFWACARVMTVRFSGKGRIKHNAPVPRTYVYGDDIICESRVAPAIMVGLESLGLLVNRSKSYLTGPFRESCGGDYHMGYDVTPVRLRKFLSNIGTGLEHGADFANELIAKFGYEDTKPLLDVIEEQLGYLYPRSNLEIPLTIRTDSRAMNDVFYRRRWNKDLQRYEHRVLTLRYQIHQKRSPNWGELLRKELSREKAEARHLYENQLAIVDSQLEPGQYAVAHTARKHWAWTWLG